MQLQTNNKKRSITNHHSHRTLHRTELSHQKVINNQNSEANIFKQILHKELKVRTISNDLIGMTSISGRDFHQIIVKKRKKVNNICILNIFKKAHQTDRSQTFLYTGTKQNKSLTKTFNPKKYREKAQTEGIRTINSAKDIYNDSKSMKDPISKGISRRLNYQKSQIIEPDFNNTESIDNQASVDFNASQHLQKNIKLKKSFRNSIYNKQPQLKIRSITERQSSNLNTIDYFGQKLPIAPNQLIQTEHKSNPYHYQNSSQARQNQQQRQPQQLPIRTVIKQGVMNASQFEQQPTKQLFAQIEQIRTFDKKQKLQQNNKNKNIYEQTDCIDVLDIEEITFTSGTFNLKDQQNQITIKNDTIVQNGDEKKTEKKINLIEQCHQKQDLKNQKSFGKKKQNIQVSIQKKTMKKQKQSQKQTIKQERPQEHNEVKQSNQKSSVKDNKSINKQRIVETIKQINKLKTKIQVFGQLATFFSKNSKIFKQSQQSKLFLRNGSLCWHYLILLFFKYFYSIQLFAQKYYNLYAQSILINRSQLTLFIEQMKQMKLTLTKIQKSAKKNIVLNQEELDIVTNQQYLKDLDNQNTLNAICSNMMEHQGDAIDTQFDHFLETIKTKIFDETAKFIRSLNLSSILSTDNSTSKVFVNGAFRIFNSCIMLYQLNNLTVESIQTYDISNLQYKNIDIFKAMYSKLTQQILIKNK